MHRQYRELILYKAYADLKAERERTFLGILWWIIEPLIAMSIYYLVFKVLLNRGTDDFIPFLLVGLIAWQWFNATIVNGGTSILRSMGLVRQVPLHKVIFPINIILTNSVRFVFSLSVLFGCLWISGFGVQIHYLAFPVILLVELCLMTAIAFPLAAIVPFVPDLGTFVQNMMRLVFLMSGIFYSGLEFSERQQYFFYLNPMAIIIRSCRDVLMRDAWPPWQPLAAIVVGSAIFIAIGFALITRFGLLYAKRVAA